jgi:hypothetical protein
MQASLHVRTRAACGLKHEAEINPFRVIWINPKRIISSTPLIVLKHDPHHCQILDGDWDLEDKRFDTRFVFIMLEEHFKHGVCWSDTQGYQKILAQINAQGTYWNYCCSESDVQARCAYLDQLFNSMKNSGYLIPAGLRFGETEIQKEYTSEIVVNIGREGRFFFWDGRHRLAIAKILDLPMIPVHIFIRHKLWQELRDRVVQESRKNGLPEHLQPFTSHPDISYLLS